MFLFRVSRHLEELQIFRPDIYQPCIKAVANARAEPDFVRVDADACQLCPSESIDYAAMENTTDAVAVPLDAGWNDVGSWTLLWYAGDKDKAENVAVGEAMLHDTKSPYVRAECQLVAAVGVEDLIIIFTKDAILVAHKDRLQDVKVIADQLKSESRSEWEVHRELYRPWSKYESIDNGMRYRAKRITEKLRRNSPCRCIITAPNIGSWSLVWLR